MKSFEPGHEIDHSRNQHGYRFLDPRQIDLIDAALCNVSPYGEVHLKVERGRLRFVVMQTSHDALTWQPDGFGVETED
jgi:hypothetical protein